MSFSSYGSYKDTNVAELGEVPAHWNVAPLKHVVETPITDGPHETPEFIDDGIPFVSAEAVSSGEINFSKSRFISHADHHRYSKKYKPRRNDIFMVKSGATTGLVALVSTDRDFNIWSPLAVVRCSRLAFPRYVLQAMRSRNFQESVILNWSFGTQQNIGMSVIENLRIPLPPKPEQTQIARFLDHETARIDSLIEEQQRLIELLKEKRQAVISHAVTKGLDPTVPMKDSGVEGLGEVPVHWSFKQSKYLLEFVTSGSRGWAEYYSDNGELFFRIANLTRDSIEPKLLSIQYVTPPKNAEGERSKVRCGDILISITADLGSVCVANNEVAGSYVSQHVALARPIKTTAFSRWLAYFVLSNACKEQLVGAGYGGTKVQLSLDDIRSFWVSVPPYEEQVLLAAFLDREIQAFDGLIAQATIGMGLLSERRSALISAAVTGKIDVRGWQPPASAQAPVLERETV